MEVGPLTANEWSWFLTRSMETGWEQRHPGLREESSRPQVMSNIREMVTQALQQPGATALVARERGQPAGYVVLTLMPDEWTHDPTGLFYDIWVEPEWRGKGVATLLTRSGENYFRSLGLKLTRRFIAAHNAASLKHARADGCEIERLCLIKRL
ncbi:MAG TPA: GNAT family N-acetyltransferase [Symbiobacteriaceae bacterium]|jgi:GNAT superfamily N-acetyltransferase|nr:GNAT family N-acetyltransferase [Symbiobacteriaceae bacterium]